MPWEFLEHSDDDGCDFLWNFSKYLPVWVTRWRSREVAGPIPRGVIGILHWHNSSGLVINLGSTQPLTEMSTKNIFRGGKAAEA